MTLKDLYQLIDGSYDRAIGVLRVEKLMDKHIRRFAQNGVVEQLVEAGQSMDPKLLFETAHAAKGVCGNLGLCALADLASEIAEEYRPGHSRTMSDAAVKEKLAQIAALNQKTLDGIRRYIEG